MIFIGWLDADLRWHLPVHQAVEGTDFMFPEWCGACETCAQYQSPIVCGVCSYDPRSGHPTEPVLWPCQAVRTCHGNPAPIPRTPADNDGNYRPRPRRGKESQQVYERTKGRKF